MPPKPAPAKGSAEPSIRVIATNRRARHDYNVLETFEAGLVLHGPEVKSLRAGRATLVDSYGSVDKGELMLHGIHIPPYDHGNRWNQEANRSRKALVHKMEIKRLVGKIEQKGLTLVPLRLYFKGSLVKVELAVVQGKKTYDKRETIRKRDQEREMQRAMRRGGR